MAGGTAPCVLNAANEVAVHAFLNGRLPFLGIAAVIEETLARLPRAAGARLRVALRRRPRGPRRRRRAGARRAYELARSPRWLAFVGFAALIILHEVGHFAAAKAVGMRVESSRCSSGRCSSSGAAARPSTAIGPIPLGRLREDHRDEPARGAAAGGRAARATTTSRCGSGSSSSAPGPASTSSSRSRCSWGVFACQRRRASPTTAGRQVAPARPGRRRCCSRATGSSRSTGARGDLDSARATAIGTPPCAGGRRPTAAAPRRRRTLDRRARRRAA